MESKTFPTVLYPTAKVLFCAPPSCTVTTVTQTIFDIVESVKTNKVTFQDLAEDASGLINLVLPLDNKSGIEIPILLSAYADYAAELARTLSEIRDLAQSQASTNVIFRLFRYNSDRAKAEEYRLRLQQAWEIFTSKIAINYSFAYLHQELDRIESSNQRNFS